MINENHFGEQSKALASSSRSVRDIAGVTALPRKYGELLFRLTNHLHPSSILELGTGLGISGLYIGAAASSSPFVTLEGSSALAAIAREQFAKMQLSKVQLIEGNFNETLPAALKQLGMVQFVFIDGDHRRESLFKYVERISPHLAENATVVIDDIYWSAWGFVLYAGAGHVCANQAG
jgi:predicted O-methyltransferase YrrM